MSVFCVFDNTDLHITSIFNTTLPPCQASGASDGQPLVLDLGQGCQEWSPELVEQLMMYIYTGDCHYLQVGFFYSVVKIFSVVKLEENKDSKIRFTYV